jgi:ubiquinone/menaquinone biosynthesis C-methylase UbiE
MAWRDATYSATLLAYLFAKTLINRKAFLYAEPFVPTGTLSKSQIEASWDAYWLSKSEPGGLIYELFAAFYRRFIIRPALNHFAGLCFPPGSKILHAGCGGGEVDIEVARKYSVSALDVSAPALSLYRMHNGLGSEVIYGSVFKIPVDDGLYDGVYNAGVMEHFTVEEIQRALDEFHRVLKPGGKILLFWPPAYGVTVRFLAAVHYVMNRFLKKGVKLHPDEITHVWSKGQIKAHLNNSGFKLDRFYFGIRDLFTQVAIIGRKDGIAQPSKLLPNPQPPRLHERVDAV